MMDVAQNMQQMEHANEQHKLNLAHTHNNHLRQSAQEQQRHKLELATKAQQAREQMDIARMKAQQPPKVTK